MNPTWFEILDSLAKGAVVVASIVLGVCVLLRLVVLIFEEHGK